MVLQSNGTNTPIYCNNDIKNIYKNLAIGL